MEKYDVIIIGAGSAGLGVSGVSRMLNLKTLIIDKKASNVGGDCLNFGCVPSKALIHIAKQIHHSKLNEKYGWIASGKTKWSEVMKQVHAKMDHIRNHENVDYLKSHGNDVVIGTASFSDKNTIVVNGYAYTARKIFLCTGSYPRHLEIPGMEKVNVWNNESLFWEMKDLPEHLVVVGGGPIGCEMAQAFSRLGSKVTIVNRGSNILGKERSEISITLQDCFIKEGIKVLNNSTIESIKGGKAMVKSEKGIIEIDCTDMLLSVGRIVNTAALNLENAGIELTERGKIKVSPFLQTSNKKVYTIGDAACKYMFSHGAEKMVRLVWKNILMPIFREKDKTSNLSWVTFTDPEIATWGYSEKELQDMNVPYWRQDQGFQDDDRAIVDEYTYGRMTLLMTRNKNLKKRKILGGTIIAPSAGEISQELMLASHVGIEIEEIFKRVYPYPVMSRINQQAIRGVYDKSFTEWKKRVARMIFKILYK